MADRQARRSQTAPTFDLVVDDANAAIVFYTEVLGAQERMRMGRPRRPARQGLLAMPS